MHLEFLIPLPKSTGSTPSLAGFYSHSAQKASKKIKQFHNGIYSTLVGCWARFD
jgi:hypothetical protein